MTDLPKDMELELAALADGSLTPERRERARERVRDSRELQAALAEQQRVVELTRAVEIQAPAALHRRLETMVARDRRKRRFARVRVGFVAAAATAVASVAVVVGLAGNGSSGLTVREAAALTLSPATMPAPGESRVHSSQLAVAVGDVPFPYWGERFGWRSSGARTDRIAGRSVTTVFYSNPAGRRIGYAIVSGSAPAVGGGAVVRKWGVSYRVLSLNAATVVSWERGGHLCVVAGRGVSAHTLVKLASWDDEQTRTA